MIIPGAYGSAGGLGALLEGTLAALPEGLPCVHAASRPEVAPPFFMKDVLKCDEFVFF